MNAYHCAYDAGDLHAPFPWPKKVFPLPPNIRCRALADAARNVQGRSTTMPVTSKLPRGCIGA